MVSLIRRRGEVSPAASSKTYKVMSEKTAKAAAFEAAPEKKKAAKKSDKNKKPQAAVNMEAISGAIEDSAEDLKKVGHAAKKNLDIISSRSERGLRKVLKKGNIEYSIFSAFILNLLFSIFEAVGGTLSGSVSILSDAVHDFGDAVSIGISYLFERKSKRAADKSYTFGYSRYSVIGALVTILILVVGSCFMIYESVMRLIDPVEVHTGWMFIIAIFGLVVNTIAALKTADHHHHSLNREAVNLHLVEDVLGWVAVLVGSILIVLTGQTWIDPILSILIAAVLIVKSISELREIFNIFLERAPEGRSTDMIKYVVLAIPHVIDVHHIHVWAVNENNVSATLHVVIDDAVAANFGRKPEVKLRGDHKVQQTYVTPSQVKEQIRKQLSDNGIGHVTIELETKAEKCRNKSTVEF